jgi:hypothetical protein
MSNSYTNSNTKYNTYTNINTNTYTSYTNPYFNSYTDSYFNTNPYSGTGVLSNIRLR